MNIRKLAPAALALAAALAAPAFAQTSVASVTTTTTQTRQTYTVGDGVLVRQGVPGVAPTEVIVPNARTAVWGPARAITNGNTTTKIQQIYVDVPENILADSSFARHQRLK